MRTPTTQSTQAPRFRRDKKWVRYAGHRWSLIREDGHFVYIERGNGRYGQWVARECVR